MPGLLFFQLSLSSVFPLFNFTQALGHWSDKFFVVCTVQDLGQFKLIIDFTSLFF